MRKHKKYKQPRRLLITLEQETFDWLGDKSFKQKLSMSHFLNKMLEERRANEKAGILHRRRDLRDTSF